MKKIIQIFLSVAFIGLICGNASGQTGHEGIDAMVRGIEFQSDEEHEKATAEFKKAFEISQPLAEQGDMLAQTVLGTLYFSGMGVSKSRTKGYYWSLCAIAKDPRGQKSVKAKLLKSKKRRMNPRQLAEAKRMAKNCPGVDLAETILTDAKLEGTKMSKVVVVTDAQKTVEEALKNLKVSFLARESDKCPKCNLKSVDLTRENLNGANLEGADLSGANLTKAKLNNANLRGANFTGANLTGASLYATYLTGVNLTNANLTKANLRKTDLTGANLTNANLAGADTRDANFTKANLTGVDVTNVDLARANLTGTFEKKEGKHETETLKKSLARKETLKRFKTGFCSGCELDGEDLNKLMGQYVTKGLDLSGASLEGVNLSGARLSGIKLEGANLTGADLSGARGSIRAKGASLNEANLSGANLAGARLANADLTEASLVGADLTRANLRGANFTGANLTGVNLTGVKLERANLTEANLTGANLNGANLSGATLKGVVLTDSTILPKGIREEIIAKKQRLLKEEEIQLKANEKRLANERRMEEKRLAGERPEIYVLPEGGEITRGSGIISNDGAGTLTVHLTSIVTEIKWQSFDVGYNATVNFVFEGGYFTVNNKLNREIIPGICGDPEGGVWKRRRIDQPSDIPDTYVYDRAYIRRADRKKISVISGKVTVNGVAPKLGQVSHLGSDEETGRISTSGCIVCESLALLNMMEEKRRESSYGSYPTICAKPTKDDLRGPMSQGTERGIFRSR
jgi:uncharacterized protein YjbI with pentapeptide repeats